jgi:hypothetical protein
MLLGLWGHGLFLPRGFELAKLIQEGTRCFDAAEIERLKALFVQGA